MKKYLFLLTLIPLIGFSQARLILNNNAYINIENSAYVVIDNGAANAITTMGTGGNILSESETDRIRWNIGTNTGAHVIPWVSPAGNKMPLTVNITAAGVGATGYIDFSTWKGGTWDNSTYVPSDVTNMYGVNGLMNNSAYVIDRFWVINHENYTTAPTVSLTFGYDDTERSPAGNTIPQGNMGAERFDNTANQEWMYWLPLGTDNYPTQTVTGVTADNTNFFQSWTLVDQANPLPIELISFNVECSGNNEVVLKWSTASETNNSHFIIEKSFDAINFFEIGNVAGAGNSSTTLYYSFTDNNVNGFAYYRLKQVDFNGTYSYSNIEVANCSSSGNSVTGLTITDNNLTVLMDMVKDMNLTFVLYDYRGRLILNETRTVQEGNSRVELNSKMNLSKGIYMLSIIGNDFNTSIKLLKN